MPGWDPEVNEEAINTVATENDENGTGIDLSADDLSQFDEEWGKLKDKRDEPEDGKYKVYVKKAYAEKSKKDKTIVINWQFCILSGPYARRMLFSRNYTATRENREFLKIALAKMGFTFEKFSDVLKSLDQMIEIVLEVRKVTNKTKSASGKVFTNVYIDRRLEEEIPRDEDGSIAFDEPEGDDEGTPF